MEARLSDGESGGGKRYRRKSRQVEREGRKVSAGAGGMVEAKVEK